MTLTFLALLAVKICVTALIVVAASMAVERVGPLVGGIIVGMPVTAGPGYFFLAMTVDSTFIGQSALMSFQAVLAIFAFQATYVILAPRLESPAAVGISLAAWFVAAIAVERANLEVWVAVGAVLAVYILCLPLVARSLTAGIPAARRAGWRELILRALMAGILVAVVVSANELVGADLTGIGLVFPTTLLALAWIMRRRHGGVAASAVMAAAILAVPGFAASVLTLHLLAGVLGSWLAMLAALGVSVLISLCLVVNTGRIHRLLNRRG